jgi:hypothetical protein
VRELAEDAGRDIAEFAHALVRLTIAGETQLEGCSEEEMAAVLERAGGFPLAAHYVAFLKRLGRQAGRLLRVRTSAVRSRWKPTTTVSMQPGRGRNPSCWRTDRAGRGEVVRGWGGVIPVTFCRIS